MKQDQIDNSSRHLSELRPCLGSDNQFIVKWEHLLGRAAANADVVVESLELYQLILDEYIFRTSDTPAVWLHNLVIYFQEFLDAIGADVRRHKEQFWCELGDKLLSQIPLSVLPSLRAEIHAIVENIQNLISSGRIENSPTGLSELKKLRDEALDIVWGDDRTREWDRKFSNALAGWTGYRVLG